ncbi:MULTISPECIES: YfjI family protein [Priestia]|uniref:YfjI family protein n=1 Tax=Priestia TaxID=2800373 RepID=UPI00159BEA9D|nr:YfjI family protein [Priestia aryabhattai]
MTKIKKEVIPHTEQPLYKNLTNYIIPQEIDLFSEELKKEAQTITLHETPNFPHTLLSKPVGKFIEDTAKALSCSSDFVAMGVLACTSVAIGNGAVLELKKSWITGASLYCAIIADPGSAKTPAINKALKPLFDLQEYNFKDYLSKKEQYAIEKENYEIEYESWKKNLKGKKKVNLENKPYEPHTPALQQIISMDSTMEALQEILLFNKRGVIKLHDELLGFIKGMNQYRAGADRQYWLSIWSNEPIIINRKGKEPVQIEKPFVSIIGGIQPDMLEEIVKAESQGSGNDGFIDRFLFCYPEPVLSNWTDEDVSDEVIEEYREIIFKIYNALNENNPQKVYLSPEAKEEFTTWYDVTERETVKAGFPEQLKGVWKKLKGLHPRIMLILHMLKWGSDPKEVKIDVIDKEIVSYTNYIMEYFKKQARKVFQYTQSNYDDKNVIKLMDYVRRKGEKFENGIRIRVNTLNQGKVFGRSTNIKLIEKTIERIEAQGLGEIQHFEYKNNIVKQFILRYDAIQN